MSIKLAMYLLTWILYLYKGSKKEKWRELSGNFIMKSVFEDLKNEERKIERSRIEELIRSENGENFNK